MILNKIWVCNWLNDSSAKKHSWFLHGYNSIIISIKTMETGDFHEDIKDGVLEGMTNQVMKKRCWTLTIADVKAKKIIMKKNIQS